jgi:hypothetical protein
MNVQAIEKNIVVLNEQLSQRHHVKLRQET